MNYYIGDLHFGHKNIMKYDQSPFESIEERDEYIVEKWKKIKNDDHVYILGDVGCKDVEYTIKRAEQLGGHLHLLVGNHDKKLLKQIKFRKLFDSIENYQEINDNGTNIVLCHYPIPCFNNHMRGWRHFYAHVHDSEEEFEMQLCREALEGRFGKPCKMYNVGCMKKYMNYEPRTLNEIENYFKEMEMHE